MADLDAKRLEALCEEVARVWAEEADLRVVGELAALHPEYAADLRDFAAYLLEDTYGGNVPEEVMRRSVERTRELVNTEGRRILREKAGSIYGARRGEQPVAYGSILDLLCGYIDEPPDAIVGKLRVTGRFLRGLGECAQIPERAVQAFAARAVAVYAALTEHVGEMQEVLRNPRRTGALASARAARPPERLCYADIVRRSGLPAEEVEFWIALDDEEAR